MTSSPEERKFKEIQMVGGSRNYPDQKQVIGWAKTLWPTTILVHGDCPNSPDVWAGMIAESIGCVVGKFPYVKKLGVRGGHFRNHAMIEIADRCTFFWDGKSRGTKGAIEYAKSLGKPVDIRSPK